MLYMTCTELLISAKKLVVNCFIHQGSYFSCVGFSLVWVFVNQLQSIALLILRV